MADQWEYLEVGTGPRQHDPVRYIVHHVNGESTDWENAPDWSPYFRFC